MRNIVRRTASPSAMLRYRAGFAGAFVDREAETKGVCNLKSSQIDVGSDLISS